MNVLNFRNVDKFRVFSKIKLNGKVITSNELIAKTGYVQQDDLFIGTLTVKEHLTFLAMLKMGSRYMAHDKAMRVEEILQEVNNNVTPPIDTLLLHSLTFPVFQV